jgi:hypothetical protein
MGYLLLAGGAEFGGRMSEPDLRAIELAGSRPSAADHARSHARGIRQSLGACCGVMTGDCEHSLTLVRRAIVYLRNLIEPMADPASQWMHIAPAR